MSSTLRRCRRLLVALVGLCLLAEDVLAADYWVLQNNTEHTFTVHLRPSSSRAERGFVKTRVPANRETSVELPRDRDPFDVQFHTRIPDVDGKERELVVPCLNPLPLHEFALEGIPFQVDRLVLAAAELPSGKYAAEGKLTLKSAGNELELGDHTGFRSDLYNSTWDTRFTAGNGQVTGARMRLAGSKGTFSTESFRGKLEDVQYSFDGDTYYIDGTWEAANSGGRFLFQGQRSQPNLFSGKWRYSKSNQWREWNGER